MRSFIITMLASAQGLILLTLLINLDIALSLQRYPRIVQPHVIPHAELAARDRRSTDDLPGLQYLAIGDWLLRTLPSRQVDFAPGFKTEWIGDDLPKFANVESLVNGHCESRTGELHGWPIGETKVLLTRCRDEFFGLLRLGQRTYLVEPLHAGKHLLYEAGPARTKRDLSAASSTMVLESGRRFYNLSGDTFGDESYVDHPELLSGLGDLGRNNELDGSSLQRGIDDNGDGDDDDDLEYFFDRNWQREKLPTRKTINRSSTPKWLELAIVADYSVVEFHGARVQQYLLALLNIVSAIYKDPSLDSSMQLVVVRMILYADKKDGMVQHGNARRSLENVNRWNRKLRASSNESHDVAVWLTRLDIGGPSGYAPVSGACDPARSCALNRDEGLTSAFIIAHEVAHILGLSHDGDKNSGNTCAREAARGSIMAPMVAATFHNFHWSTCSRKEFHRKAKHWSCLMNKPSDYDSSITKGTFNEIFSMDEQCRMEFGEGYSRCRSLETSSLCAHLWCGRANSSQACKTKKGPPLEGTLCAENKWCMNGICESIDQKRSEPISLSVYEGVNKSNENSWSSWSTWSDCSGSCGIGVRRRSRRCSINFCEGDTKEYKICELPSCTEHTDLRARQCSRFFYDHVALKKSLIESNGTWLPYESFDGTPNCQLVCYRKGTGEIFHTGLDVEDGTSCSYESSNICIDGKCRQMGCDGLLNSGRIRDACGVCDGNNSTCENVVSKFQRKLKRETTRLAVIPRSSYNVKIMVTILMTNFMQHEGSIKIMIRDGNRKRHEISDFDEDGRASVLVIDGAAFRIERRDEKYMLWCKGPVTSEIVVSLVAARKVLGNRVTISASSQYVIVRSELRSVRGRYTWIFGLTGPCSVECGGGVRRKQLLCRDETTRELVSRRKCLLAPKPRGYRELERCNTASCDYTWLAGTWERCSTGIGIGTASTVSCAGTQRRRLYCVHSSFGEREVTPSNQLRVYRNTVSPAMCGGLKAPPVERACVRSPECDGTWVYDDWSPCSQTCGRGVQTRRAKCVPYSTTEIKQTIIGERCGTGPPPPPDETRACKGVPRYAAECNRQVGQICRDDDKSQIIMCSRRDIAEQCRNNSTVRRRCCQSCRAFVSDGRRG